MDAHMATLPRTENRVARALAETLDPREALERALAAIGEGLGWRLGAAWEPPPGRPEGELVCVETWCAPGVDDGQSKSGLSRSITLSAGEGLPGRVWSTGEAAWVPDVETDPNWPPRPRPPLSQAGLRAAPASRYGARAACSAWPSVRDARPGATLEHDTSCHCSSFPVLIAGCGDDSASGSGRGNDKRPCLLPP